MAISLRTTADVGTVAYFSMEVGLDPAMPTYSGGLGVLAGDTLRAAADFGVPMVAVTLLHRKGCFRQHLDAQGNQTESCSEWSPEEFLEPLWPRTSVTIEGRPVRLRAWRYPVHGFHGHTVPLYLLDSALSENSPWDQTLTDQLYGGDDRYRLCQEALLGLGGVAMLSALGHDNLQTCHMNEGHSALLALALLEKQTEGRGLRALTQGDIERVRSRCVFTTHTPVPAGHDAFPVDLVRQVLGEERTRALEAAGCLLDSALNMTYLALFFSRYINGVSLRHEQISKDMFANYPFNSITNGVHAVTWASPSFRQLYDHYIPEWRHDNRYLRYAVGIPLNDIQQAHGQAKRQLIGEVERRTGVRLDPEVMTVGFARRAAAYKRPDLLFHDLERLKRIAREVGPLQIVYGGKAHPRDEAGKLLIRRVFEAAAALADSIPVVYLEEYDMTLAKYICAGVDLWLNTPQRPQEASGTSGMKAAINGVPSLSVLDGWWIEGHVEGVTGWSIGDSWEGESNPDKESESLYDKLEYLILPTFYNRPAAYAQVMRSAIALNGSFFNAQRMISQYVENAYSRNGIP
ncbi:MAG: alpha-glucan family phosphorylase [Dehalococcoidia bacterium]